MGGRGHLFYPFYSGLEYFVVLVVLLDRERAADIRFSRTRLAEASDASQNIVPSDFSGSPSSLTGIPRARKQHCKHAKYLQPLVSHRRGVA